MSPFKKASVAHVKSENQARENESAQTMRAIESGGYEFECADDTSDFALNFTQEIDIFSDR